MDANGMIKIGPAGKKGGGSLKYWDVCGGQITQILIWYGENSVNAIQFQFVKDECLVLSDLHGDNTYSKNFIALKINHPSEYIIELSGQLNYSGIIFLTIVTNLQTYGPIGNHSAESNSEKFRFQIGEHQFGGFHGTVDSYGNLRSIGVYLKLPTTLDQPKDHIFLPA